MHPNAQRVSAYQWESGGWTPVPDREPLQESVPGHSRLRNDGTDVPSDDLLREVSQRQSAPVADIFATYRGAAIGLTVASVLLLAIALLWTLFRGLKDLELRNAVLSRWPSLPEPKKVDDSDGVPHTFVPPPSGPRSLTPKCIPGKRLSGALMTLAWIRELRRDALVMRRCGAVTQRHLRAVH